MHILTAEDIDDYDDEDDAIVCPFCEERGYQVRLTGKILMKGEPRPDDYDEFRQCPTCYYEFSTYQLPKEEEIKDNVETNESPYEAGKFVLETIPKRTNAKGKRISAKRRHDKLKLDEDKEIDALLRAYGDRVTVIK